VVYGGGAAAQNIQLDTKTLMVQLLEFYRKNTIVTLKVEGASEKKVMVGEVQTDPVRDTLIHVDFCEIDLEKERAFTVPVVLKGKAKGIDLGGQMIVGCTKVVLVGKPLDIPDECIVDVAPMAIGDEIKCSAITLPENVKMVTDPEDVVISIIKPGVIVEEAADTAVKK
jgi:large subunit ribosomal protein L25